MNNKMSADPEKFGYNAFINAWVREESTPRASSCPARFMKEGTERDLVIKGWVKAKKELENSR